MKRINHEGKVVVKYQFVAADDCFKKTFGALLNSDYCIYGLRIRHLLFDLAEKFYNWVKEVFEGFLAKFTDLSSSESLQQYCGRKWITGRKIPLEVNTWKQGDNIWILARCFSPSLTKYPKNEVDLQG